MNRTVLPLSPENLKRALQRQKTEEQAAKFFRMLSAAGLPLPEREVKFDSRRQFRFDLAWGTPHKLALEVEGGIWIHGDHSRGKGVMRDIHKYNLAILRGWRVVRCTPDTLCTDATVQMIADLIEGKP